MSGEFTDAAAVSDLDSETAVWLQHHTGPPLGGSFNVSANSGDGARLLVSFGAADIVTRSMANDTDVTGAIVVGETISHWSLWTSQSGGAARWQGTWDAARTYLNGDSVVVEAGALVLSFPTTL